MEIKVCSLEKALDYKATKSTYIISIRDNLMLQETQTFEQLEKTFLQPLVKANRYNFSNFDDMDISNDGNLFQRIIIDFDHDRKNKDILLVHCYMGLSRSPAVAAALNEIFKLGTNTQEFLSKHFSYCPITYEQLIYSAKRMNLLF